MTDAATPPIFRVRELTVAYKPHRLHSPFAESLTKPEAVAKLSADILQDAATEVFLVLHLNVRNRLIGIHRIPGTLSRVDLNVADICRAALLSNAHGVIVVRNHPGGDVSPSDDDRQVVQRLRNAVRILDLELMDAVIVVDPTESTAYYSFQENGLL
jgi:DNA repair protein RadC